MNAKKSDRCPDKHVCVYRKDKLECECRKGWNGTDCRTNPDNCIDNVCKDGAACFDMLDDYACIELVPRMKPASLNPTTSSEGAESTRISTKPTTPNVAPASDNKLGKDPCFK